MHFEEWQDSYNKIYDSQDLTSALDAIWAIYDEEQPEDHVARNSDLGVLQQRGNVKYHPERFNEHYNNMRNHILFLVHDQQGAKLIQLRLSSCSATDYDLILKILLPHLPRLIGHVFGNHVVQKLLEVGSPIHRHIVYESTIRGNAVRLALQAYSCRVMQKALDCLSAADRVSICSELAFDIKHLIQDQNGNHVIQKAVDRCPAANRHLIANACVGEIVNISLHSYGCRVVQRILEHCPLSCTATLLSELASGISLLIKDQFGNYVVQHILKYGRFADRQSVISLVVCNILDYSCHKYASNVVERCLEPYIPVQLRQSVVIAAFDNTQGKPPILSMVRDPYANYVVQRILASDLVDLEDSDRREVLEKLQKHLPALRKFTYGRHIVEGIERLRRRIEVRSQ